MSVACSHHTPSADASARQSAITYRPRPGGWAGATSEYYRVDDVEDTVRLEHIACVTFDMPLCSSLRTISSPCNTTYNPLQKLAYTTAFAFGAILVVTGFALYKPVQLSPLVTMLRGFRLVRIWHFAAMCGLLAFIPGHIVMVAIHGWKNFVGMWTGGELNKGSG